MVSSKRKQLKSRDILRVPWCHINYFRHPFYPNNLRLFISSISLPLYFSLFISLSSPPPPHSPSSVFIVLLSAFLFSQPFFEVLCSCGRVDFTRLLQDHRQVSILQTLRDLLINYVMSRKKQHSKAQWSGKMKCLLFAWDQQKNFSASCNKETHSSGSLPFGMFLSAFGKGVPQDGLLLGLLVILGAARIASLHRFDKCLRSVPNFLQPLAIDKDFGRKCKNTCKSISVKRWRET